jgi:hypothetical protein
MRSYFSQHKSSRQKDHRKEDYNNHDVEAFKEEQAIEEVVQRRQIRCKAHNKDQLERATSTEKAASSSEKERHSMRNKTFIILFQ